MLRLAFRCKMLTLPRQKSFVKSFVTCVKIFVTGRLPA